MACSNAGHPGNDYYVNRITGTIQRASGPFSFLIKPAFAAGPFDWCGAKDFASGATASGVLHSPQDVAAKALDNTGLGALTSRALWIRIAEGVLGIALILVAVAELGKGTAAGAAVKKLPFF